MKFFLGLEECYVDSRKPEPWGTFPNHDTANPRYCNCPNYFVVQIAKVPLKLRQPPRAYYYVVGV